ncbi:protein kinase [Arthroderma uncinatum]|uniref:protein kinase n=1 Tax=Arthroderma uncinatum TaxID=74035 RepID=UPI00144ABC86|nr:protein kinase [Arthroderma uncinatum]KAF3484058.1 protein kinase [Arthroderma uncinatum]
MPTLPGILTVTLHEVTGFSTVDCYNEISGSDPTNHSIKARPSQYRGNGFVYALLDYEMLQVSVESFFGTSEGPRWPAGYYAERELYISHSAELRIYLYIGGKNTIDKDIFLGVARVSPFEGFETSKSQWLEVEDGVGRIRVSFDYRHVENNPLKSADFEYIASIGRPHAFYNGKEADHQTYAKKNIHLIESASLPKALYTTTQQSDINHPFIAQLSLAFNSQETLHLLSPFISGGHLFHYIQKQRVFDIEKTRLYAAEILCALEYLHDTHSIFSWLKPGNVLLDSLGHIVLCGFSLFLRDHGTYTMPEYPAPELFIQGQSETADWWTLGIFLYEMLTGLPAFYDENPEEIRRRILDPDQPLKFPKSITPTAEDFIIRLLDRRPENRLGANGGVSEIKAHPFFVDVDWNMVIRREYKPSFKPNYVARYFRHHGFPIPMPEEFHGFKFNQPQPKRSSTTKNIVTLQSDEENCQEVDDGWELVWEYAQQKFHFYNHFTEAKQLVTQPVDPLPDNNVRNTTAPSQTQKESVLEAALLGGHNRAIPQLLEYGMDLNINIFVTSATGGKSPLGWATEHENLSLVTLFLDMGADATFSALNTAVKRRNEKLIKVLMKKTDRTTSTKALGLAVDQQDITIAKLLLENGAKCDFNDEDRPPPEHHFAGSGFAHNCPFYDISSLPEEFIPPLVRAVKQGCVDLTRLLLAHGADVNTGYHDLSWDLDESPERDTISFSCGRVIQLAMELGELEIVQLLLLGGADIHLIHPTWCVPGHQCWPGSRAVYQNVTDRLEAARNKVE